MDLGSIMGMAGGMMGSKKRPDDPEYKEADQSAFERLRALSAPQDQGPLSGPAAVQMAQQAPGYSYQYKHPNAAGAAPGQQFGVMAQDLERTPAGKSVVHTGPTGTKYVDTPRLTMQNTAAIGELANKMDSLEELRKMRRY